MATIRLSELPEAMRSVLAHGEALDVTDQGEVVARLVPVAPMRPARPGLVADLAALDALATRIGAAWKSDKSAVEAVSEQRR